MATLPVDGHSVYSRPPRTNPYGTFTDLLDALADALDALDDLALQPWGASSRARDGVREAAAALREYVATPQLVFAFAVGL